MGEPVRAHGELVELGARDLPLLGDHLGAQALRDEVVLLHQRGRPRRADLLDELKAGAHRDAAEVLDARSDDDVVDARRDQRGAEVHGLLGRAALAVDRRRGGLDRQPGLQPRVARDVPGLLADLLHAAGDDVLDLGRIDSGALDDLGEAGSQQLVGVRVPVVALLGMAAPDRRPDGFDDDDLAAVLCAHAKRLRYAPDWRVNSGEERRGREAGNRGKRCDRERAGGLRDADARAICCGRARTPRRRGRRRRSRRPASASARASTRPTSPSRPISRTSRARRSSSRRSPRTRR